MAELAELLRGMLAPLKVEYRTGCLNHAAVGGFDRHLVRLVEQALSAAPDGHPAVEHLQRMRAIFEGYGSLNLAERAKRLREVKRRLDAVLAETPPATARLEPVVLPPVPARPEPARADVPKPRPEAPRRPVSPADLDRPVQYLRGVGPQRARLLERLGIETVGDLLGHFPRRHEDRSHILRLADASTELLATYQGVVRSVEEIKPRRGGLKLLKAYVTDGTGGIDLVWFNQPWLRDQLPLHQPVIFSGRVPL